MKIAFRHDIGRDFRYVIAQLTGRPVHVAVLFGDVAYEADWSPMDWWRRLRGQPVRGGVRVRSTEHLLSYGEWRTVELPVTAAGAALALRWCKDRVGIPYDVLGVLVSWYAGRVAKKWNPQHEFCSRYAAGAITATGDMKLSRSRASYYTPSRLSHEIDLLPHVPREYYVNGVRQ